ncbi:cysteine desulfurase [Candidatus Bathyarchaeota archaeon]|nr:cysteine desulfurase [Candidatus Bathyarchaeota archaeon]MBS7631360.1 cysteine desulfurase [Candidatus Bathyarchaeota archaeon]
MFYESVVPLKVYMDYASGSPVDERVLEDMKPYFSEHFGNPSSFHSYGFKALEAIKNARMRVGGLIEALPEEIVFTSGATEANNLALIGAAARYKNRGSRIVISSIEHISILNVCKELSRQGFEIKYAPVDKDGILDLDALTELVDDKTMLVSVMTANGEIGTIQPIKKAAEIAHDKKALFHTDATVAAGKIPLDVNESDVDLMTLSSNDLYGPKGMGALYVRRGIRLKPIIIGGGQEGGMRSGTENVPGIVGMGKAAELAKVEMRSEADRLTKLRDRLINGVLDSVPESYLNGHPIQRLPNNANIRFSYIEGESLLLSLDELGVQLSSGSACAAKTLEPSHVLIALGLKHEEAHGSLVFTLGKYNTGEQIDYVIQQMPGVVKRLRAVSPLTPKELM